MSTSSSLKRLSLALGIALVLAASYSSALTQQPDPEPVSHTKGEAATPAIDLDKAKTDAKLAAQADRNQKVSKNNLSQIGIAVHNYHDAHKRLPGDITDKLGKPLLSWRVLLLPHLEQAKLYKEFKLDEPWDSKHNKKLLAKMPEVFRSPRVKVKAKGNTVYQVFTGPNAVFGRAGVLTLFNIPDGTSNTLLAVESSQAVPWTKPGGIPFDRRKNLPDFGKAYGKKPLAVMMDGSPRLLDLNKIQAETLKNAIDPMDGNVLGRDWTEGATAP
jgi:hypothetical protein